MVIRLIRRHFVPITIYTVIVIAFFLKLFYPEPSLIVTPDFGLNDSWQSSYANRAYVYTLTNTVGLPLINNLNLQHGYPLAGEGEAAIFYPPNIILTLLIDNPTTYYNISLLFSILFFGWGIYALSIHFGIHRYVSLFTSIIMTFSGAIIPQMTHVMVIQSLPYLPWILLFTFLLLYKQSYRITLSLAILTGLQILTGFPQTVFITHLSSALIISMSVFVFHKSPRRTIFYYLISASTGLLLASIQLIPSFEYSRTTGTNGLMPYSEATRFSLPIRNLVTIIDPYILGSPQDATYEGFPANQSIFWENNLYVGPFVLIGLIGILFLKRLKTHITQTHTHLMLLLLLLVNFVLMIGESSPFYFLYQIPPFNLFRVPARFSWTFILFLVILAGIGFTTFLDVFRRKSLTLYIFIILATIQIFSAWSYWHGYHLTSPSSVWLKKPAIVDYLDSDKPTISFGMKELHNDIFLKQGWNDQIRQYLFLRNTMLPNGNVLWNVPQFDGYLGRNIHRFTLTQTLIQHAYASADDKDSSLLQDIISLYGIGNILTTDTFSNPDLTLSGTVEYGPMTIRAYRVETTRAMPYLTTDTRTVHNLPEMLESIMVNPIGNSTVFIEQNLALDTNATGSITTQESMPHSRSYTVHNLTGTLLFVDEGLYYPGWKAFIDRVEVPILPVNISQRGVILSDGTHEIEFIYEPSSIKYGASITGATFLSILLAYAINVTKNRNKNIRK